MTGISFQLLMKAITQKLGASEFLIAGGPGFRLTGGSGPESAVRIGDRQEIGFVHGSGRPLQPGTRRW